jgi:hypothetical protein
MIEIKVIIEHRKETLSLRKTKRLILRILEQ